MFGQAPIALKTLQFLVSWIYNQYIWYPGAGVFVVCDATNGAPLGIFQENRYLTDLRTGAAGAICVKNFVAPHHDTVYLET